MRFPLLIRRVEGHSMWPTLAPNDIVLATPLAKIKDYSIVIAKIEGCEYIKRVQAVENSGIRLLGDNYYHSRDSRQFGLVDKKSILGVVLGYPRTLDRINKAIKLTV